MPIMQADPEQGIPEAGESFWKTGTFMGTSPHFARDLAMDFVLWDALRDIPVGKMPYGLEKYAGNWFGGIQKYWTTGGGSNYASSVLGKSASDWAKDRAAAATKYWSFERAHTFGRFSGDVSGPWMKKTVRAGYGEARVAERMGRSFLNKEFWSKSTPWMVRAAVGGAAVSNVAAGVWAMSFSAPAIGFSLARIGREAFVSAMIDRGARDVGRLAQVNMAPTFYDSREASTMRQAAMMEIQNTQLNLRSAFGREASAIHR